MAATPIKNLSRENILWLWQQILLKFVKAEEGKGLSSNDLTDELLAKIELATGNTEFDGSFGSLTGLPTINGVEIKDEITLEQLGVTELITNIFQENQELSFQIVEALPEATDEENPPKKGCFYLLAGTDGIEGNSFDEYIWITANGTDYYWEKLGTVPNSINLTGFVKEEQIEAYTEEELQAIIDEVMHPEETV